MSRSERRRIERGLARNGCGVKIGCKYGILKAVVFGIVIYLAVFIIMGCVSVMTESRADGHHGVNCRFGTPGHRYHPPKHPLRAKPGSGCAIFIR